MAELVPIQVIFSRLTILDILELLVKLTKTRGVL